MSLTTARIAAQRWIYRGKSKMEYAVPYENDERMIALEKLNHFVQKLPKTKEEKNDYNNV